MFFGWLFAVLVVGCAVPEVKTSNTEPTLPTTHTSESVIQSPQPKEITFQVTFDENHNCIIAGPTEVPTGDYLLSLNNLSDTNVDLAVNHLIDGHSFQDLLDLQSEPGEPFNKVYWMSHPFYFTRDHKVWTYSFDEAGEYVVLILQHVYKGIWICDPFQVTEAPIE